MLGKAFVRFHGKMSANHIHQYWLENMVRAADIANRAHHKYGKILYNSGELMALVGYNRSELESALIRRQCLEEINQAESSMKEADELLRKRHEDAVLCGVPQWKIILAIL